ncbi:MAG: tetratricopeptide repeat protein [Gammaproteobacteria bacterium]|nr:tetratricopeptide repeat protein [Gammaproteobacteria bacterium]
MRPALLLLGTLLLGGCTLLRPPAPQPTPPGPAAPTVPAPGAAVPAPPAGRPTPAPRTFHLSAAAGALVSQSHTQSQSGDFGGATATLERALRIDPDNPLLWIELGRLQLAQGHAPQADAMGHKALALATGDGTAQASAWHLVADALRARGRNGEAAAAEQKADGAVLR